MPDTKPELIECRACGHQISVKAKSCPNCGDRYSLKEKYDIWKKNRYNRIEQNKSEKIRLKQNREEEKRQEVRSYGDPAFVKNYKDNGAIFTVIFICSLIVLLILIVIE